jgi:NAD(P)-dependent dehydrogenase (short-subunit alcohol dehydrogenase family)
MSARVPALVTGAAKRIGRAIALDLAAHGFDVAIHCRSGRAEAEQVAGEAEKLGARAAMIEADLTDAEACAGLIDQAQKALGKPIRLLVNNASLFEDDSLADFEWAVWDRHFALHLKAPVELARHMAAALPDGADGLVVNMIDQRVWRLRPQFFSYTLSKSALWTATQTMAQALAPRVRVNAIGPGPALRNERQKPEDFARQVEGVPLKRGPELDEFGRTVRYLWEARSITGQMIALDGGQHLAWQTPDVTGLVE